MPSQILKQGLQSNTFLGVSKCLNPWPRLYNGPYDENRNAPKTPDEIHRYWDALMFCPVQNPWVDAEILLAIAHPEVFLTHCVCAPKKNPKMNASLFCHHILRHGGVALHRPNQVKVPFWRLVHTGMKWLRSRIESIHFYVEP